MHCNGNSLHSTLINHSRATVFTLTGCGLFTACLHLSAVEPPLPSPFHSAGRTRVNFCSWSITWRLATSHRQVAASYTAGLGRRWFWPQQATTHRADISGQCNSRRSVAWHLASYTLSACHSETCGCGILCSCARASLNRTCCSVSLRPCHSARLMKHYHDAGVTV